ncbi:BspA family leucine-rich repeat surface protein [Persicobacter diffluens]|uniref:Secretion system C-terminal sorting domain-containing protein n=1 Tax=Persicobacter diffluens TaxID=981 RepID=A0AAN4W1T9_9BACT|nr:hypothetical protein PEDI_36000 [Persicobacter diffluens]
MKHRLQILILFLLGCFLGLEGQAQNPFVFSVEIEEGHREFLITFHAPHSDDEVENVTIYWGDGVFQSVAIGQEQVINHQYQDAGRHAITIEGEFSGLTFCSFGDNPNSGQINNAQKVREVLEWGDNQWYFVENMFSQASEFTMKATDAPNLSSVTSMRRMFFRASKFRDGIGHWDVSNVTNMSGLFNYARAFNENLNDWDVSQVTNMYETFYYATSFNNSINQWEVGNVENMSGMFYNAWSFDQSLNDWDVSKVSNMSRMFYYAWSFNQNLSDWDVSEVGRMDYMFYDADSFNQNLGAWDVGNVTNMSYMFKYAYDFKGNGLELWDVSSLRNMRDMFYQAEAFQGDLSQWDVGLVTNMRNAFRYAISFNSDLSEWDVGNVTDMDYMFTGAASFNSDISNWDVSKVEYFSQMLHGTNFSHKNYDALLVAWSELPVRNYKTFGGVFYCSSEAQAARNKLQWEKGWNISDSGRKCPGTAMFLPNGGEGEYEAQEADEFYKIYKPSVDPTRAAYEFVGWYVSYDDGVNLEYEWDFEEELTEPLNLYAKWEAVPYQINYEMNGGYCYNPTNYTIEEEVNFGSAWRTGYSFDGWFYNEYFEDQYVYDFPVGTTGDTTLYAKWDLVYYRIYYSSNGGNNHPSNPFSYHIEGGATLYNANRTGYDFSGWYTNSSFWGAPITAIPVGQSQNYNLYAKWTPTSYDINYVLNGGSNLPENPTQYTIEDAFSFSGAIKAGYSFEGWYLDPAFSGNPVTALELGKYGDLTLYAKWVAADYLVKFELTSHGDSEDELEFEVSAGGNMPDVPVVTAKPGYVFMGWDKDFPDSIFKPYLFVAQYESLLSSEAEVGFKMYPNPARKMVRLTGVLSGQKVSIFTVLGTKVYETSTKSGELSIDVSQLHSGVYLVLVDGVSKKLIVE